MQKGCCGGSGGGGAGVEQQYGEGAWTGKGRRWCGSEGVVHKVVARWGGGVGGCVDLGCRGMGTGRWVLGQGREGRVEGRGEGFRKAVQKVSVIRVSVLAGGCRPRYERGGEGMIAPAVVGCFCMDESSRGAWFSCRIYDSIIESVFNPRLFLI